MGSKLDTTAVMHVITISSRSLKAVNEHLVRQG